MPDLDLLLATVAIFGAIAPIILVPTIIALVDFVTRWRANQVIKIEGERPEPLPPQDIETPFEILIPIFGDMSYLKNVEFLSQYPGRVILCTTDAESDEFERDITAIAKEHDFRIFRSESASIAPGGKPNPWRLFSRTLTQANDNTRDEIIRDSFTAVTAPVCIFLDGDTVAEEPLQDLVRHFVAKDVEVSSVRVLASKHDTLAECLQAIEYKLAMDARRVYPWLTSGACMVARTEAMREIMSTHSLFFSGGDIEIGKLAMMLKMRVGHVPFDLFTDVPETFRAWFKQRMAWFGGGFRHAVVNFNIFGWRHPFHFAYQTVIVFCMIPARWYETVHAPWVIALVICIYIVLLFIMRVDEKPQHLVLFPIYALVQVMFIVPLGIYTYAKMAFRSKNLGLIRLRESAFEPSIETATIASIDGRGQASVDDLGRRRAQRRARN